MHRMINSAIEYEPGLLNTFCATRVKKLKLLQECKSSLALLPPRDFAVFERQCPPEYYTQRAKNFTFSTRSLAAWGQFISNTFPSISLR